MLDIVIPVLLGSCALGFALMAWRAHNRHREFVDGRTENTRRLLAMTVPYPPPKDYPWPPLRSASRFVTEPDDAPVPVRERGLPIIALRFPPESK